VLVGGVDACNPSEKCSDTSPASTANETPFASRPHHDTFVLPRKPLAQNVGVFEEPAHFEVERIRRSASPSWRHPLYKSIGQLW